MRLPGEYVESQKAATATDGIAARRAAASPKARRLVAERGVDISALRVIAERMTAR